MPVDADGLTMRALPPTRTEGSETPDPPDAPRIYTIWPASQDDLPAATSGPWQKERHWLVLDVTDGIASSYVVEGPVAHPEALHRAAEIQGIATKKQPQEDNMGECWRAVNLTRREYINPNDINCGLRLQEWNWADSPVMRLIKQRWSTTDAVIAISNFEGLQILQGAPPGMDPPRYHSLDEGGYARIFPAP